MPIEKVLAICFVCKKIRIGDDNNLWLKKEDNPVLYERLVKAYEGRLSHTYCPEDYEKKMKEIENMK